MAKEPTEPTVLPIDDLPKDYQELHTQFQNLLADKNPLEARRKLRKLIAYYIDLGREIPVSIEVGYGKLLMLEELQRAKKD
jgi:hypothetical protein